MEAMLIELCWQLAPSRGIISYNVPRGDAIAARVNSVVGQ